MILSGVARMRGSDSPVECVKSSRIVKGKVFLFKLNLRANFNMISFACTQQTSPECVSLLVSTTRKL